jgi:cell shape-determining protein MreC
VPQKPNPYELENTQLKEENALLKNDLAMLKNASEENKLLKARLDELREVVRGKN